MQGAQPQGVLLGCLCCGWGFVCLLVFSAGSTMQAGLQLQLMGPGEQGREGRRKGTECSSSGQGGTPSEPSSVGRTGGTGEEEEEGGVCR